MSRQNDGERAGRGVFRLAPGFESIALDLTPEEAFLLSRVDGMTPWTLLVEMSGLEPGRGERCLSDWRAVGVVEPAPLSGADGKGCEDEALSGTAMDDSPGMDPSSVDPGLGLGVETQRRILEFESRLGGSYHEILGVDVDADLRTIKKAYFQLSREFHPDRFFRCELGAHGERLSLIFKTILGAYESLSETSRTNAKGSSGSDPLDESAAFRSVSEDRTLDTGEDSKFAKIKRLGQRAIHTLPRSVRRERSKKAQDFFEGALASEEDGLAAEAEVGIQLAIRFDPGNLVYRNALNELQGRIRQEARDRALNAPMDYQAMNSEELDRAMNSLEESLNSSPEDSALLERAALVALARDEPRRARSFAQASVDRNPEVARFHTTLGRVHSAQGHAGHARREFEIALEHDPQDSEARHALADLMRQSGAMGADRG